MEWRFGCMQHWRQMLTDASVGEEGGVTYDLMRSRAHTSEGLSEGLSAATSCQWSCALGDSWGGEGGGRGG